MMVRCDRDVVCLGKRGHAADLRNAMARKIRAQDIDHFFAKGVLHFTRLFDMPSKAERCRTFV